MDTKERFKLIPSVYALFIQDGNILLLRRVNTGFEDGNYGLVSGHADGKETMREAMRRETLEEAGVMVKDEDMQLAVTMHRWCGDHERIDFFFAIEKWEGDIKNMEPNKCDDLSWFPLNNLPGNTILYIQAAINCYLKGERYCEFGWGK